MEKITTPENNFASLKEALTSDISTLLEIEKSVSGTKIYSPMLDKNEWEKELKKGKVYLIEKNNNIVGSVAYEQKNLDYVYISGLAIKPIFQGQGIAREVLIKLLQELKITKRIYLVTHPDNLVALKLYQNLGFVIESRKENYFGDGEPRLVLILRKE